MNEIELLTKILNTQSTVLVAAIVTAVCAASTAFIAAAICDHLAAIRKVMEKEQ